MFKFFVSDFRLAKLTQALPALLLMTLSACAANGQQNPSDIKGEWVMEDIVGRGMIDSSRATLIFGDDGEFAGRASCNTMGSTYRKAGQALIIGPVSLTRMMCPPAIMNQEAWLIAQLKLVEQYRIDPTGGLILEDADGQYLMGGRRE